MAQTVTAIIGARMRQLRDGQGMSAQQLAARMSELGIPWKREIVANLETGRRAQVGVDEVLALALVLDVPPTALLLDPQASEVALTPTVTSSPVSALLWLLGEVPAGSPLGPWGLASAPVRLARRFHHESTTVAQELVKLRHLAAKPELAEASRRADDAVNSYLHSLWRTMAEMRQVGMAVPELAPELAAEARQRGIEDQQPPTGMYMASASHGGTWEPFDGER